MVLIQLNLSEKANKKLDIYVAYTQSYDKRTAINKILEELNLDRIREEYFEGKE